MHYWLFENLPHNTLHNGTPLVTFIAAEYHCCLADSKLHCLVTEVVKCKNMLKVIYMAESPTYITHNESRMPYN